MTDDEHIHFIMVYEENEKRKNSRVKRNSFNDNDCESIISIDAQSISTERSLDRNNNNHL